MRSVGKSKVCGVRSCRRMLCKGEKCLACAVVVLQKLHAAGKVDIKRRLLKTVPPRGIPTGFLIPDFKWNSNMAELSTPWAW